MSTDLKKENGVVFTPEWIADFMIDETFKERIISGNEKILDAGCGEGIFTILAAKKFSILSKKPINKVIEENIYFIDISTDYINKVKETLQNLTKKTITHFNCIVDDYCFHVFDTKFDFIIGNPPYVRIQNLNDRKNDLQRDFITASNGSIDLYFCFFERSFNLLNNNGLICFITPNSHFHSAAGKNLRNILSTHLKMIVNFDHFQVFQNATAYTAITILQKEITSEFLYANNFVNNFNNIEYKLIKSDTLKPERWSFHDKKYHDKIIALNKKYPSLQDIADIHYGIATLKDDIYIFSPSLVDNQYLYINNYKIEKELCVPIIKASTYKGVNQNLYLIFPYQNGVVIPSEIFKNKYPATYKYFLDHREILENRDKGGGKNYNEFYEFGRNQGLKTSFGKKIITSTMNINPHFYVIDDDKFSFYAGYCIKPRNNGSLNELCDILNSDLMKEHIDSISKSYRGGYKSYAKSFLKDFVHPKFLNNQLSFPS